MKASVGLRIHTGQQQADQGTVVGHRRHQVPAKRVTERRLVDVLVAFMRQEHAVSREVRHYEKRIDVAIVTADTDELWAIEAKTTKWTQAIAQAIVNLAAADRSYVAIYTPIARVVPVKLLEDHGLGLIAVGTRWGDVAILRKAPKSPYCNRLVRERLYHAISEGI